MLFWMHMKIVEIGIGNPGPGTIYQENFIKNDFLRNKWLVYYFRVGNMDPR